MRFFADRSFCCGKYPEFDNVRLYNLVGADLAEKGRIILMVSEIFAECRQVLYYSPYERSLPCAVYLPELSSLVVCGYNDYSAEKLTNRYFDVGRILSSSVSPIEQIVGYTINQSSIYMRKSLELLGIADLLLKQYIKNSAELIKVNKLKTYTQRKIASMLGRNCKKHGSEIMKAVSAITCNGYRFTELPEDYKIIRLCDNLMEASRLFVRIASRTANKLGFDTIVSSAADTENSPLHLIIPEIRTVFVSESDILKTKFSGCDKINLSRFYESALVEARDHEISFFAEYIRKIYSESALYARICMDIKNQGRKLLMPYISEKAVSEIASEIVYGILNS